MYLYRQVHESSKACVRYVIYLGYAYEAGQFGGVRYGHASLVVCIVGKLVGMVRVMGMVCVLATCYVGRASGRPLQLHCLQVQRFWFSPPEPPDRPGGWDADFFSLMQLDQN